MIILLCLVLSTLLTTFPYFPPRPLQGTGYMWHGHIRFSHSSLNHIWGFLLAWQETSPDLIHLHCSPLLDWSKLRLFSTSYWLTHNCPLYSSTLVGCGAGPMVGRAGGCRWCLSWSYSCLNLIWCHLDSECHRARWTIASPYHSNTLPSFKTCLGEKGGGGGGDRGKNNGKA